MPLTTEEANALLPAEATRQAINPITQVITIIAEPKWGKTTWMTDIPNSLLLAFEKGHSYVSAYKIEIDAWDYNLREKPAPYDIEGVRHMSMVQAQEAILASDRFDFIIIDTADMAGKMCLDYHLKKNGLIHSTDWEYGKGGDVCLNTPFRQMFGAILKSGRGIGFITHSEIKNAQFASGTKSKRDCSLPGGLVKFIIPQSDVILNGKFGPKLPNSDKPSRILVTQGTDDTLAGSRVQRGFRLPNRYVVDAEGSWAQFVRFFDGEQAAIEEEAKYAALLRGQRGDNNQTAENEGTPPPPVKPKKEVRGVAK